MAGFRWTPLERLLFGAIATFERHGNNDCLIDTQNQKRDFVLPNIRPPSGVLPPIGGFFPDFGGLMPSRPGLGQINLPRKVLN
jgi:hypothetical protein